MSFKLHFSFKNERKQQGPASLYYNILTLWHEFDKLPVSTIFTKQSCHHSLEPAGSQMKKSALVWVHHFYWVVSACFCICCIACSVDSSECVTEISTYCNIFSVFRFCLLFIGRICLSFSRQEHCILTLVDCFVNCRLQSQKICANYCLIITKKSLNNVKKFRQDQHKLNHNHNVFKVNVKDSKYDSRVENYIRIVIVYDLSVIML